MVNTIMVVDDEQDTLDLLSDLLKASKYKVQTAISGGKCLSMLKKSKPDLIVLDVMMPKMDGVSTAKKIKADPKTKDIPIIFLTAGEFSDNIIGRMESVDFDSMIQKPFDNDRFLEVIAAIL